MKTLSGKCATFVILALALSLVLSQNGFAKEIPDMKTAECCPQEANQTTGIAGGINGVLAFGCRLNYCLTNWILSDKCNTQQGLCDFSREKPLCELGR